MDTTSDDASLVARARQGDMSAFSSLLLRHGQLLEALCRRALPFGAMGWYLHNFARHPDHKGAGWVLLGRVLDRADARGWTIYLDTVVPRLVEYYAAAGFEVAAAVPATYAGENVVVTRMVRPPRGGL